MKKNNDFHNLIKDSLHDVNVASEEIVSITSLEDVMLKIKKEKRRKFINYAVKPMMIVLVVLIVGFLTIMFSDLPLANALKFNLSKVRYNLTGGDINVDTSGKNNYTVLTNNDELLEIEFYDVYSAKNRIGGKWYYALYIPYQFDVEKVNWKNHIDKTDLVTVYYDDVSHNKLAISTKYVNGNYDDLKKEKEGEEIIDINGENGLLQVNANNQFSLLFPYKDVLIEITGDISKRELIKIAQSITD